MRRKSTGSTLKTTLTKLLVSVPHVVVSQAAEDKKRKMDLFSVRGLLDLVVIKIVA